MKTHLKQKPKQGLLLLENDDGKGNIIEDETEATQTYLYITVSCKTVDEIYSFQYELKTYCSHRLQSF